MACDHAARGLPRTLEQFLIEVAAATENGSPGGPLTYELAEQIGAIHLCDVCQEPIIDIEAVSDWLLGQYDGSEERRPSIEEALRRSGLELGDPLSPNYCSYHGQITSE